MNAMNFNFSHIWLFFVLNCSFQALGNSSSETYQDKAQSENEVMNGKQTIKSGLWRSGGNNPFWIRVVGKEVFWLGMNLPEQGFELGQNWSNVGHGKIKGNKIEMRWVDIPNGKDNSVGNVIMEIVNDSEIRVYGERGDFGQKSWLWASAQQNIFELSEVKRKLSGE